LFEVVQNFQIGEVWLGRNPMIPQFREFLVELERQGIPIRWVHAGETIAGIEVLHPPADWKVRKTAQNNDSVVLMIPFGQSRALLTGDLEMNLKGAPNHVDVLKVPHHGSRTTKLNVQGDIRVISVGANNPFGHPDASKLPALRTDTLGAIRVHMGKNRVWVE
jgi:competence protein ComEC